ncbi:tripartite tricarboxylate transporter substrate binding protein [Comamonas sp. J-3]|uniref:tripartite tricarboxylate transporter substrate binding protein n=1 Tax=Comamonas trifloxystrobinivorans TaxID=3350256 RepID=UPI0037293D56
MQRRHFLHAAGACAAASLLGPAWAQAPDWPSKALRIVVPFPPGGTTDMVTRLVGNELGKRLGQPVIVDNKPGAGTVIGVDHVAKQAADGYTLVCVANSFTANASLLRKLPYDTRRDLQPVALLGLSEHVLATHPGSGLRSLADLKKAALAQPGKLSYASFGNGTSAHLSGALLCQMMGIDMVHVPYKGQGPAMTDLIGGQVTLMFGNWAEFHGQIDNGKLVALGMATRERSRFAPAWPTLAEQGVALESNSWQGLLAPAGTPQAIVQRLNTEANQALASPTVTQAFAQSGIVAQAGTVAQFSSFVQSEMAKYQEIIERAQITAG